ncbi:hypothetical protein D9M71_699670 [compost metagenome]
MEILQVPALDPLHLVRVEQVPVTAPFHRFHEQVRQAHRGEHIVRAQALVAVVQAQVQEILDVTVPYIQVHRDGALALAQLVHADRGVVELLDPRHHATGRVGDAADRRAGRAHVAEVGADAAAMLGDAGHVGVGVVDALQAVVHRVDEAR